MKIKHLTKILAGSIAAVGLAVAFGSTPSQAGLTGTINLTGAVASNCNVVVTASGGATLDSTLSTGATASTPIQVGSVVETCNDPKGYVITVASLNGVNGTLTTGLLKGAVSGNPDTVPYNIAYGATTPGTAVTLAAGSGTASTATKKTPAGGTTNNVFINFTGNSNLSADTYTDTLTVTMTKN